MLPNLKIPPIEIFGLELHAFGFLVGLAIITGTVVAGRRARALGLSERVIADVSIWAVLIGFPISHIYSAVFYFPEKIAADPIYLLKVWDGISSFGGFLGGTLGVWLYFRRHKNLPFVPYAESLMYGFAFAWIFGRLGCTVAFDHPGVLSDFALAMDYEGQCSVAATQLCESGAQPWTIAPGFRHNLGMYEAIWTIIMGVVFFVNRKKPHFPGWYMAVWILCYVPIRFTWDFLRVADKTPILGLTGGQLAAIALAGLATWLIVWGRKQPVLIPDGVPKFRPADEMKALEAAAASPRGTKPAKKKKARAKR